MQLNNFQKAVARCYQRGVHAHIARISDPVAVHEAIESCDDPVFQMVMDRLVDCPNTEEAIAILNHETEYALFPGGMAL